MKCKYPESSTPSFKYEPDNEMIKYDTLIRPQSINCLIYVTFAIKNWMGGQAEVKKFGSFEKKIKYQQNKGEGVCSYPVISMYIYMYYLYSLFMFVFICIHLQIQGLF